MRCSQRSQGQDGALGAVFLAESHCRIEHHDRCDGDGVCPLSEGGGQDAGTEQQPDHRVVELRGEEPQGARALVAIDLVRSVLLQATARFRRTQSLHGVTRPLDVTLHRGCQDTSG